VRVFDGQAQALVIGEFAAYFLEHIRAFWRYVEDALPAHLRGVVLLDKGGWLSRALPDAVLDRFPVVAVEHTMQGLFTSPAGTRGFPVILMAASAAKTRFESCVIADGIVERLVESVPRFAERRVGIIGLGNLGQAMAKHLKSLGQTSIFGYDREVQKAREHAFIQRPGSLTVVAAESEVLLGCTGQDAVDPGTVLPRLYGLRWLASASSADVEFQRVAKLLSRQIGLRDDPFVHARGTIAGTEVVLLNGGFPLNFDRERERESPARIQLTRELTYASVLQAALCVDGRKERGGIKLDAATQEALVHAWLRRSDAASLFPNWHPHGTAWWRLHSIGEPARRVLSDYVTVIG
jgi:hypothetical protein